MLSMDEHQMTLSGERSSAMADRILQPRSIQPCAATDMSVIAVV